MKKYLLLFIFLHLSIISSAQLAVQWSHVFGGAGSAYDQPKAMTCDLSGNYFVTLVSQDSASNADCILTIKYNSAGVQQWATYYYGPGGSTSGSDSPTDIAVDASGNVYVIGSSPSPGAPSDYVTLKYNSAGVQQWEARYTTPGSYQDIPAEVAVDNSGNVYVTGWAGSQGTTYGNFVTVKYNASGTEQWNVAFSHGTNYDDRATSIAIDVAGNVYVGGWSYRATTVDTFKLNVVKYNPSGVQQWASSYTSSVYYTRAYDIAVDLNGNVFAGGYVSNSINNDEDWFVIKFTSSGQQDWMHQLNNSYNKADNVNQLITDAGGNIYATGFTYDSLTYENVLTIKYDNGGNIQWMKSFDGPSHDTDIGYRILMESNGNVYVAGITLNANFDFDYLFLKYDNSGNPVWSFNYDGGTNDDDYTADAVLDGNNDLGVTGYFYNGNDDEAQTIKFSQTTGLNEKNTTHFVSVYPNPVNSELNIQSRELITEIKIYDIVGKEVFNSQLQTKSNRLKLQTSNYTTGVYFIEIISENKKSITKFIKTD
ncbi:MAG: SBBP repeat-containing protein [Bacteroidia bacterium]